MLETGVELFEDNIGDINDKKALSNSNKTKEANTGSNWQLFVHLFDSKYIDSHLYRLVLRNGTIDNYNSEQL